MLKTVAQFVSQDILSFMDPELPAFAEEVRTRLEPAIPASWTPEIRDLEEEDPRALAVRREWDRTRMEAGFGCIGWPVEYGGNSFTSVESSVYDDICAELDAPQPMNLLGYGLAGTALINWGNEEQKQRFLPRILSGEDIWCEGFSEPGGGSDMANYQTTAYRTDHGWHIQGSKIWTTFSPLADRIYCLTRSSLTAPKRHNMSVFLLDMHAPGVEVRPIRQITGITSFGQVFIDTDITDAEDLLLGKEGEGWNQSSIVGAQRQGRGRRVGGAGGGRHEMHRWVARLRECANETDASPSVFERIDELELRYLGQHWQGKRLIELSLAERDASRGSSVMKIASSELTQAFTSCGIDIGCPRHEEYWRSKHFDYRKLTIAGGPNEIYRNIIANRVLGMGR
jgi:alkylation response protein AidB-like acyl-CoA dehydrogenase